ncbi:hypothetical protein [Thalassococcus profundi]|uniref:hypothetical protein n=1 Tax=Thalassococcus profundi TaxID=2282382 RepID=UPI0040593035
MPHTVTTPSATALDKFYTRAQTAGLCLAHMHEVLPDLEADLFVEPAAGDGAFYDALPRPRLGMDIAPDAPGIETRDFLSWTPDEGHQRIVVVGNPPFGQNAGLAIRFFNKAAEYAEVIAMILPASLMKSSMQGRLDAHFHLVSEMPLPGEAFRVENGLHRINAVFQVWRRGATPRAQSTVRTAHPDFSFVATPAEADFALRRVGGRAGVILPLPAPTDRGYSPASNYFVKAVEVDPEVLEARFARLDFSEVRDRVAANPSISKREIVTLYEAQLALETLAAPAGPRLHEESIVADEPENGTADLASLSDAGDRDLVAMIVRTRSRSPGNASLPELVEFRWRLGEAITPVLRTALRGKSRRKAVRLLAQLFAGGAPFEGAQGEGDRTSVLFRDGVLHLDRLAGRERRLRLVLRDTGECDAVLFERERTYHRLGRAWLAELGDLEPPPEPLPCLPEVASNCIEV